MIKELARSIATASCISFSTAAVAANPLHIENISLGMSTWNVRAELDYCDMQYRFGQLLIQSCGDGSTEPRIDVRLMHDSDEVVAVSYEKNYVYAPFWDELEETLLGVYGPATKSTAEELNGEPHYYLCYGDCQESRELKRDGSGLLITFISAGWAGGPGQLSMQLLNKPKADALANTVERALRANEA